MAEEQHRRTGSSKFAVIFIAVAVGLLHRWHVSTLFENDRHFSHLSEIEREMSFRTEMGMYYSYFKTIAESKTFMEGWEKIRHDNISEYGNVIDATKKYSLLPELLIGWLYHHAKDLRIISIDECWQIERGAGITPVTSCEGLGVPVYFYLNIVWICSACTVGTLFYYSTYLGKSMVCGILTVLLFFYNHVECTRVQWTPPLRESFAYPMILFQMYMVTMIVRERMDQTNIPIYFNLKIGLPTLVSLCFWQFSHFVFSTQIIALLILKWTKVISNDLFKFISVNHVWPIYLATKVTDEIWLHYSLYQCLLMSSNTISFLEVLTRRIGGRLQTELEIAFVVITTQFLKSQFSLIFEDDAHVFNILKAKLTNYKDFHTMLYTCSTEYDFLPFRSFDAIIRTMLLPLAVLAGVLIVYYWYRVFRSKGYPKCIEADLAYNGLQTGAFIIMAVFIMRLKLFMNPHLCIIAGSVCASRYLDKVGLKNNTVKTAFVVLVISAMSYHGLKRLREERNSIGEFSNIEQEELFEWIKKNTPEHAVFAGKMSLMANLMLSTGRPIVNNPYYESKEMRERTMKVYEIFSRKDVSSVYMTLRNLKVGYVILEEPTCLGVAKLPQGCQMIDLWDLVDNGTAKANGKPPLCPTLYQGNAYPFKRVFVKYRYVILQLDYSQYVELKPKNSLHYQS